MPRYARIHVTSGLFHIISRFHDRRFFLDIEGARQRYLELLGIAVESHDSRLIAYCLMSSHVHLVLQLGNDTLGSLTKRIHSPFANWINARRGGLGPVFADRPKSVLVYSDTYGLELMRYVHNNPVRAGVVARAADSGWSSHRIYLGLEQCPPWLATEALFGPDLTAHEQIRGEFARFVDEGRNEPRRPEFCGDVPISLGRRMRRLLGGDVVLSYPVLGPDDFVVEALKEQVQRHRTRQKGIPWEMDVEIAITEVFTRLEVYPGLAPHRNRQPKVARARALVAWLWSQMLGRPQVEVAEGLKVRPSAVSRMLAAIRRDGLTTDEEVLLSTVLNQITDDSEEDTADSETKNNDTEPRILVVKRIRRS